MAGENDGTNITYNDIDANKVINKAGLLELSGQIKGYIQANTGGGSSYTFTNGLTESNVTVSYDLYDSVKLKTNDRGYNYGNAICIGKQADMTNCNGKYCVAIGSWSGGAYANYGTVIGGGTVRGEHSVAIGYGSNSWGPYSVAIGPSIESLTDNAGYFPLIFGVGRNEWLEGKQPFLKTGGAWDATGDLLVSGDLYIQCNDFRSERYTTPAPNYYQGKRLKTAHCGGSKVATEAYVDSKIPAAPANDGTYMLKCVVSNGEPTYSWENVSVEGN